MRTTNGTLCLFDNKEDRVLRYISSKLVPPPGFYSQGVVVDPAEYDILFTAGQTGNVPETDEVIGGGLYNQTVQALSNLLHVVMAAGGDFHDLIKVNVYLKDPDVATGQRSVARKETRLELARAYEAFFRGHGMNREIGNLPARTLLWASEVPLEYPAENTLIELDAVAAVSKKK